jgi:TRAP-type mannitol/chloroaromatic compound transport system permease small subunit
MIRLALALRIIDKISIWSAKICRLFVFGIVFTVLYEVIARTVFNAATIWSQDTSRFLFGAYAVLAGAYVYYMDGHVRMDILYTRLSPRKKAIINSFTTILTFLFLTAFFWWAWILALKSLAVLETVADLWAPPYYPFKFMFPLGSFLLLLQVMARYIRDLITAITGQVIQ